jgi:hypothetical protein
VFRDLVTSLAAAPVDLPAALSFALVAPGALMAQGLLFIIPDSLHSSWADVGPPVFAGLSILLAFPFWCA